MVNWTSEMVEFLSEQYPRRGLAWCAETMEISRPAIRMKASRLGLRQDRNSEFFAEWQDRAAQSKVGKKRPEQAAVMKRLHDEGKLLKTPDQKKSTGERIKQWQQENGHPRGALGLKHTARTKRICGQHSREMWAAMTEEERSAMTEKRMRTAVKNGSYARPRHKTTWKAAWREIGGKRAFFRSRWEANYARYLEFLKTTRQIKEWEHEPEVFWFEGVKRGCVSYLPDFRVTELNGGIVYHEVKGWMDARSKTKIKRMAKYHPDTKLIVIGSSEYRALERDVSTFITDWEK